MFLKSELQNRAERAAKSFRQDARKPIVLEFAGVPKAGKTSTLNQLRSFLNRCGFRAEIIMERASVCPIRDKKHANFNVWTACTTLAQILEKTQVPPGAGDPDILILDRGIFDSICWITTMERLARISPADKESIERFLLINDWRNRLSAVFVMTAAPKDAIEREQGYLPVIKNGDSGGSIMNESVLKQINRSNRDCMKRLENDFRFYPINTSSKELRGKPKKTVAIVADIVLALIEEQIKEEILVLPKNKVKELFSKRPCLDALEASALAGLFTNAGEFGLRKDVEENPSLVQALPIVVVRNATGAVLKLQRREKSAANPLHGKFVIWAGGHVRQEDAVDGNAIIQCARRELQEELRLSVSPGDLRLIGAVYMDAGERTAKHAAIAYEWRAKTDDIVIVLNRTEFLEKSGASLSGSFTESDELMRDVEAKRITDPWSVELLRECLFKDARNVTLRLL